MRRFLTGAVECGPPSKIARTASPERTVAAIPVLINPTVLTGADLLQAQAAHMNGWISYEGIMYKLSNGCASDSDEMVAFDMDGTLIKTKSGKTHAIDENDWTLFDPNVRTTIQRLHAEKKYLAIISNQSGIKESRITKGALQRKVEKIIEAIGVPMDFICAIEDDRFRKPRPGMWEFLLYARKAHSLRAAGGGSAVGDSLNPSVVPHFAQSTYIGDAAGRPKEGTRNKDWSDSDYKVALNVGVKFCTPEKFFHGATSRLHSQLPHPSQGPAPVRLVDVVKPTQVLSDDFFLAPERRLDIVTAPGLCINKPAAVEQPLYEETWENGGVDGDSTPPRAIYKPPSRPVAQGTDLAAQANGAAAAARAQQTSESAVATETNDPAGTASVAVAKDGVIPQPPELLVLAAPPACGKSTLARRLEQGGYLRVNQDTLGSLDKCMAVARTALVQDRRSVCVDNTNMDANTRQKWIQLAKQCGVQARAVALKTPKEVCNLLATFRLLDPTTPSGDRRKIDRIVINTYFKAPLYPTMREGFTRVDEVELDLRPPSDPQALRYFHMYLKG